MSTFYEETQVWVVDGIGTLNAGGVTITKLTFCGKNAGDEIVLTDNADKPVTKLMCGLANESRDQDFGPKGKKLASLKVANFSANCVAYIHFRTDI